MFAVSRAIIQTKLSGEVGAALEDYGLPVFKSGTTQRVVYPPPQLARGLPS